MNWYAILALTVTALSFAGCVAFTVLYALWWPFWRSAAGLNIFLFTLGLGVLDGAFVLIQIDHSPWIKIAALLVYIPQPIVIWWRVALLILTKIRTGKAEGDPDG